MNVLNSLFNSVYNDIGTINIQLKKVNCLSKIDYKI